MASIHRSPKYSYDIGNWGRRIPRRSQNFDRKLGNSRFCARVVQIWFPYAISLSHIHLQQYPLWNTALLMHCNNAGIAAPVSGNLYKSHMKHRDSLTDAPVYSYMIEAMVSTSAPAKPGTMPSSSPWIIVSVVNSCSYRQPLV